MREFITKNRKETGQLAGILAKEVSSRPSAGKALVIGLEGELGAGKTVFAKAFGKALGIKEKISSPTFVLIKSYKFQVTAHSYSRLIHIDTYRLKDHQDLISLGIKETMADPQNIILIEWSDRISKILPKDCIKIHIDHISESERKVMVR